MRPELLLTLSLCLPLIYAKDECIKFSTNDTTAATYDYHRFFDFRNLHSDNPSAVAASTVQSQSFSAVPWTTGWNARSWLRPQATKQTIDMHYNPSQIFSSQS
jgi:hypothetical protein